MTLQLTQSPDHCVQVGDTIYLDGDPFVVLTVKPQRESGVFVDFNRAVQSNIVIVTVERFGPLPTADDVLGILSPEGRLDR